MGPGDQDAHDGERHAHRAERVVDDHDSTRPDAGAPDPHVGRGRAVAVGAVDVEHVDLALHLSQGVLGEGPDVTDAVAHAGALQVGVEHLVVGFRLSLEAAYLVRSPVRPRVGIDGDHGHAWTRRPRQHDRGPAPVGADLHDHPRRAHGSGPDPQQAGLGFGEPPLDACGRGQPLGLGRVFDLARAVVRAGPDSDHGRATVAAPGPGP